ncbi:MAG: hypothetical protein OEV66_01060 [Spirochaetia bacterium]|nr:hypothetical protein [Spirochaetia bacterium]
MKVWNIIKNIAPDKIPWIVIKVILLLAFFISLMPIIAWWGGLVSAAYLANQLYKDKFFKNISIDKARHQWKNFYRAKFNRLALYGVLFGILIHVSCRVHSQLLIHKLYNESIHEKNLIISNIEKE